MNISFFKKIFYLCLVVTFLNINNSAFAQSITNAPRAIPVDGNTYQNVSLQNSQANTALYGSSDNGSFDASSATGSFVTCSGAGALGNFAKSQISSLLGSAIGATRVPVGNPIQEGKDTGILGMVSWDQIGWCLVNATIESIGAATVDWINSGFQGNSVFVEDPAQFFADVADIQAGVFINELSNGFLCEPIRNIVTVNLASNYNNRIGGYSPQCTFTGAAGNIEQFMAGDTFGWADWNSYTQDPYNNPFGASIYSEIELDNRIASALGIQSKVLDWGAGFFSKKDPETGRITSPGSVIEKQVNDRLGSGQRRLEIADEFDEVVNALVNQLIKVAISEMTQ